MPGQDFLQVYQLMVVHVTVIALELWTKHYIILIYNVTSHALVLRVLTIVYSL